MKKPIRAGAILIKNNKILLMHRFKNDEEYYVFPGGSVEKGETPKQAVVREILEETSIKANVEKILYEISLDTTDQHYYLCNYISGKPKLGKSIEKEKMDKGKKDIYIQLWFDINKLSSITLYPLDIRDKLITALQRESL
ncbi:MAG: NUDIX domain-containing protein [bacterium]